MNGQVILDALSSYPWRVVTPGGVVCYGTLDDMETVSFGSTTSNGADVSGDAVYDLASLTKPFVAATIAKYIDERRLHLMANASDFLPKAPKGMTIKQLLGHGCGFPAHVKFYETLEKGDGQRQRLLDAVCDTELAYAPGTNIVYSDLGYMLLGYILETVADKRLDEVVTETVLTPLGLESIRYVDNAAGEVYDGAVPTEEDSRGLVSGQVHDENAYFGGGIFGHAGLFGTAHDLAVFARAMIHLWHGENVAGLPAQVVRQFLLEEAAPGTWRLGWDTPSPPPLLSHAGSHWHDDTIGHLGFSGTSLWINLAKSQFVIILTNRVFFSRDKEPIRELRRHLMDAATSDLA